MNTALKFSQTFSKSLGEGLAAVVGVLFGIFFIMIFSAVLLAILIILLLLRKFVFKQNKIYKWIMRIIAVIITLISISFITKIIALPNAIPFAVIPLIPTLLGIYLVSRKD